MDDHEFRKLLNQLHDEINNTQSVDDKGSDILFDLKKDINALLERSGENPMEVYPATIQQLDNTLCYFEVTHPSLTAAISKVLDFLSNAGI
jgi:hypothetical protein